MHQQYFYFGSDLGVYLINGINVKSSGSLTAVCLFVGFMSFIFEYLR